MYEEAARDLEGFWLRRADELVDWAEPPTRTLDQSNAPFYRWFADGKLNVSHNCLDRHVEAAVIGMRGIEVELHVKALE